MKNSILFISAIFFAGFLAGMLTLKVTRKPCPAPLTPVVFNVAPEDTLYLPNHSLKQEIITLNEKSDLKSAHVLDSITSMWAINHYIQHGRFPDFEKIPEQHRSYP